MSRLDRAALIYERIANSLTYRDDDTASSYNITGPVLLSAAVCAGYAGFLVLCYRAAGIPCIKISGKAGENAGKHAWCVGYLYKDSPCHLDVTWDSTGEKPCSFRYFGLSDRQIKEASHFDFVGPRCTEVAFSRYNPHRARRVKYA